MRARFHLAFLTAATLVSRIALAEAPIKVGVPGGFPFAVADAAGAMSGLYVELPGALAAQTDTRIKIEILPFPRLRQYLTDGSLTAVLAVPNSAKGDGSIEAIHNKYEKLAP